MEPICHVRFPTEWSILLSHQNFTNWDTAIRKGGNRVAQNMPAGPMSALGHVWTAPWQELSDVSAALVGCGHVSGLLVRPCQSATSLARTDKKEAANGTASQKKWRLNHQ